ncbi:MAG: FAD-dependent monooxygenase [Proteobacteria bacterium]|nr:FAD-dependent monooxygenase [Pseudomonadota bacterium]
MALLLEQLGIRCVVLERREGLHNAPQAHVISSRTLEICRSLGIDHKVIRAAGTNPTDTLNIRWVDRLLGRDLGVYSLASDRAGNARMFAQTPTPICNLCSKNVAGGSSS